MDSRKIIQEIADKNLIYIMENGYAKPGQNGPYKNIDTPVRNSAHWIFTYSWLWKTTGKMRYLNAVYALASYLLRSENYGSSGSIICRTDKRFDSTNGLIGQAWAIEGLICAAEVLEGLDGSIKAKKELPNISGDILIQKAHTLFKVQKFDKKSNSWNIVDSNGTIDFDQTYNHQLWFAASGAMILEKKYDSEIDEEIKAFLSASDEKLFQIKENGLIVHSLNRKLTCKEQRHQKILNNFRKVADIIQNPCAVAKRKLGKKRTKYPFTYRLEEGYHLFDLYGFALLKKRYADLPIYQSQKLKAAIHYAFYSDLIDGLSQEAGEDKYNKFAYGYNSPAFEYPFIAAIFNIDENEIEFEAEKLFNEQIKLTYDENEKSFLHCPDPVTLEARVYELVRYFELIDKQRQTRTEKNELEHRSFDTLIKSENKKKHICFMTDSIRAYGGRQRVTSVIVNTLCEKHDIEITLFCTEDKKNVEKGAYALSEKVHILTDDGISGNQRKYLPYKVLRFLNKNVHHISNVNYLRRIYFPNQEVKKYQKFFSNHKFDAIIGIGTRQAAMLAMCFYNEESRPRLIAWYHTPWSVYFQTPKAFQWKQEELYKYLLPKLDLHIVLTKEEQKRYLKELGNVIVEHIYNPLTFRSKQKSTLRGSKLLFVGRLDYDIKGLDYLVEIFEKVKIAIPDAELTVVGDGLGRNQFEKQLKKKNLDCCTHMVGLSNKVREHYLQNSVCLVTSRQEGFGLTVTEAMECGVPVVSFKTEGPSEIIENGISGYLVDKFDIDLFANRVITLCKDEKLRNRIGQTACERAKKFSIESIAEIWVRLIDIM